MAEDLDSISVRIAAEAARGALDLTGQPTPTALPVVSSDDPAASLKLLRAIKSLLDTREGRSGSVLDKNLTLRDLMNEGALVVKVGANSYQGNSGGSLVVGSGYSDPRPVLTKPPTPTNLTAQGAFKTIMLTWQLFAYANHAYVEIWRAAGGAALSTAVLNGTSTSTIYTDYSGTVGQTYSYWVRAVSIENVLGSHNASAGTTAGLGAIGSTDLGPLIIEAGNLATGAVTAAKILAGEINATKFAASIEPIGQVASIPGAKGTNPNTIFNTGDGKLYRWSGTAYVATVPATDLSGALLGGQITAGAIGSTHLTSELNARISSTAPADTTAPGVVTALSANGGIRTITLAWTAPADTDTAGYQVWRAAANNSATATQVGSSQGTVYSDPTASGTTYFYWVKAFDISGNVGVFNTAPTAGTAGTTGAVASADILNSAITAVKIANGEVSAAKLAVAAINSATGNLSANSVLAANIQAGEVIAGKLSTGSVVSANIQAGQITTSHMVANTINANVLSAGSIQVGQLAADAVVAANIKAGEITTSKMAANTIDGSVITAGTIAAAKLVANSITAGQIQAFAIGAGQIAAGAISTAKLLVTGQGAALNADPLCVDPSGWDNNALPTSLGDATAPSGGRVYESTTTAGVYGSTFPIDSTRNYRVSVWVKTTAGAPATYLTCAFFDANNNVVSTAAGWSSVGTYNYFGLMLQVPPSAWTKYVTSFGPGETAKTPTGAVKMWVGHLGVYTGSAGAFRFTDYRVVEKADFDLIVDGAIIAGKLAANSIAVGTAAIQNAALTNAMIANLAVDDAKIAMATISGAKIANATITDANIGSLSADKITAGTINAGRIAANSIDATKINSNGLSVRDAAGNIILSAGSSLDFNARFGNTTGMPANGATVGATWGSNLTGQPADTDLLNTHTQGNVLVINHPGGGNFADNRDNLPGAIKIRLPVTWTNTMVRFFVEVYEYEANRSFTVEVGGYTSGNGAWLSTYAKMTGSAAAEKKIYFGHDDTKCCIWIGEPGSTWRYPQVTVTNFRAGYSGHVEANWKTGWQVSLDTSLDTTHAITGTVVSPLTGASWSEIPAGTGKAADNATVGATAGTNLRDAAGTLLTDAHVKNSNVSISSSGVLSGAGGGTVSIAGMDNTVVRSANPINTGNISTYIASATISTLYIGANQITVPGYTALASDFIVYNDYSEKTALTLTMDTGGSPIYVSFNLEIASTPGVGLPGFVTTVVRVYIGGVLRYYTTVVDDNVTPVYFLRVGNAYAASPPSGAFNVTVTAQISGPAFASCSLRAKTTTNPGTDMYALGTKR